MEIKHHQNERVKRWVICMFFQLVRTQELAWCLSAHLCLTVEPAARGATVLLGDRPEAPTLAELAAGTRYRRKEKQDIGCRCVQSYVPGST